MIRFFILICALLTTQMVSAQYFQFSQYNYTPQRINPAAPANSDYAQLSFIYRNQATGGDQRLSSNLLSASYPLINKKNGRRWSGVGVTLMDDRSGGLYSLTEGSLSYAVNVFLSDNQSLSLGFQGKYQQRKIDVGGLSTGLQYVPDRGFDEFASTGEDINSTSESFATVSAGLSWQNLDDDGIRTGYLSFSLFDFNQPKDSYIASSRLNSTFVAGGGFRLLKKNNLSLFPEALYTRGAGNNVFNVGLITRCNVKATGKEKPFYVDMISKYVPGRSFIFGLQFHNENFSFGASYDFARKGNPGNLGAFEIGIELKSLVAASLKNKAKAKAKMVNKKPANTVVKKTPIKKMPEKKPVATKNQTDSLKQKKPANDLATKLQAKHDSLAANAKAGKISHEPFVLDKVILHFNFRFNSTDIDETSSQYLNDLIVALKQDDHLRIKLTGHTDNVGSEVFNDKLSLHRANAIKDYLVSKGVDASRVDAEGKGLSEPLNENKTEEDRAKNRRVELTILYKE